MRRKKISIAIMLLISLFPSFALAVGSGGFENASFSAASIGQSNAVVAQADEPAAISYNPAGLSYMPGIQVQSNAGFIDTFTRHSFNGGTDYSTGTLNLVPTGYMTVNPGHLLGDRLAFGIGSDSPFGLANQYNSNDAMVHYTGYVNYLKMYTIKPVASLRVADWLSIGGGPVYNRIFNFGGVQAYPNLILGGTPADGQVRLNLAGNSWSWQMGALLKPHKKHQLGFYFRSPVTVRTRGLIKVENSTTGGNFETGGNAKIDLPLNITAAYAFKPTERDVIEADFGFTRWAAFERLFINADPVNAGDDAILNAIGKADKDYRNAFSLHLGGKHNFNKRFSLSAGSLFYWTPIPKDHYIPAVPDANRLAFTFGAGYEIFKNLNVDISYFAGLNLRREINNSISESIGGSVDGKYFSYIQGIYATLTFKWDSLFVKEKNLSEMSERKMISD